MLLFRWQLIVVFAGCLHILLPAQWRSLRLSYVGPEEGLHAQVYDMTQDSTGFLYFGTNNGLYRYDGHSFEFFGHDPKQLSSIGGGDVYRLLASRDGLIWMTLRYGGLNSFNPKTGEFKRYPLPDLPFRSIPSGSAIFEDDNNVLWIGAMHFRLMSFDREKEIFKTYTPEWIDPVKDGGRLLIRSIVADQNNPDLLWLSVLDYREKNALSPASGIVSFDKKTGQFQSTSGFGEIRFVEDTGLMWGSMWGPAITRFDPATKHMDTFNFGYILKEEKSTGLSFDISRYNDDLLIATSKGILSFDELSNQFEIVKSASNNETFISLFTDRDQNLWIGTNQGAYILDQNTQHIQFFALDEFGTTNRLFPGRLAFDKTQNVIYLAHTSGQQTKRIYKIPLDKKYKKEASFISTDFLIHGLTFDHHNRLWIGGDNSFHLYDSSTGEIERTSLISADDRPLPWLWNMKSNDDGWIGAIGMEEFIWFHADLQQVKRVQMDKLPGSPYAKSFDNDFDGFSLGKNNRAYLFSNEIFTVDLTSGEARALKFDQTINPNFLHIQYVGEDEAENIWISTVEIIGKFRLVNDSLILQDSYTIGDGMISPTASELHIDDSGLIWTFTHSGMNGIAPESREVRYFGTKEGLPNPSVDPRQVISISNGRIATVCANGVIVFNTVDLWNSVTPSDESTVIKQIRISGEEVQSDQSVNTISQLTLKPSQKLVDIEFQALAYPNDYRMEYSYRISGLHDEWISIGQNKFITLPSLSPGHYTFEVKAGRPQSSAPVKKLSIHVITPLYKRTWFLIFLGIIVTAGILALMQYRIQRIRRQETARADINKKIAELELKALRSQMNPHFMFNSLNSIKNYILNAEPRLAAEYLSNFAHLIRMILQNSREKSITLQDELETLVLYIELERLRFDEEFDFNCSVDDGLELDKIKIPPMLLQPYVENAIWHGLMHKKEKGILRIHFSKQDHMINCSIEDNGVGRSAAEKMKSLSSVKYKSMGMGITKDRIEIMNKMDALGISTQITDMHDHAGNPSGTRVTVCIPNLNGSM